MLHEAISSCWPSSCHSAHEVNLLLNDRLDINQHRGKASKHPPVQFRVVFAAMSTIEPPARISRDSYIEVLEDEPHSSNEQIESGIRFVLPQLDFGRSDSTTPPIDNICREVCDKHGVQQALRLYVHPKSTIRHHQDTRSAEELSAEIAETATLRDLLKRFSASQSHKRLLPLARAELALAIASTMVQLGNTPWSCVVLTKENVRFARSSDGEIGEVNINEPMTVKSFSNTGSDAMATGRKMVLELAIFLLELWHETLIEDRFRDRPNEVNGDDLNRQGLAIRWLAEDRTLLSFQSDPVSSCLGYLYRYDEISWADEGFFGQVCSWSYRTTTKSDEETDADTDFLSVLAIP